MRKRIALYIVLIILAVGAGTGLIYWRFYSGKGTVETLRSAVVERGSMLVAVSASGSIAPHARVNLSFETPGRVAEVLVAVGDTVKAGDTLARLDTARLTLQVKQARAALAAAEAQLAQAKAPPRPEELAAAQANLRAAEAQVAAAVANRDQLQAGASAAQIAAAEADLAAAKMQQWLAEDAHNKTMSCFTHPVSGEKVCPGLGKPEEQARYNLDAANKALAAAQARLDELLAGAKPEQLRAARANVAAAIAQRDAVQAQLELLQAGATKEQIAVLEAQVEQARVALELAELALEQATLRAPFAGVVAAVNIKAGEVSPTGLPAIVLLDTSAFHITVSVDEMEVGKLAPGQVAEITLDAFPDAVVGGRIERIAPAANIQGGVVYYDVTIALDPTDIPIRADMTANATILVEELTDVLKVPTWVVRVDRSTGQTYVHKQVGTEIVRTDVKLGVRHEGFAQVLDGLAEGDVVVWVQETGLNALR